MVLKFLHLAGLTVLFSVFVYVPSAQAYIDPGSGSMILQAIVASIAAGFAFIGVFWQRIKSKLFGNKSKTEDSKSDDIPQ